MFACAHMCKRQEKRDKLKNNLVTSMTSTWDASLPSVRLPTGAQVPSGAQANRKWVFIVEETHWQVRWCPGSDCDYAEVSWACLTTNLAVSQNIVCTVHTIHTIHTIHLIHVVNIKYDTVESHEHRSMMLSVAAHYALQKSYVHGQVNCKFMFWASISADLGITLCVVRELVWFYIQYFIPQVDT